MTAQEERLTNLLCRWLQSENRYKDGYSDERWSDAEMAQNKRSVREDTKKLLDQMGLQTKGL